MYFLPTFLDRQQFYLTLDYHFLVDQLKTELTYIRRHWSHLGRPTVTLLLTKTMLLGGRKPLLQLFQELNSGECNGVKSPVRILHTPNHRGFKGTEFLVAMRCESAELSVVEGKVLASSVAANTFPTQTVTGGQTLTVGAGQAPAIKLLIGSRGCLFPCQLAPLSSLK